MWLSIIRKEGGCLRLLPSVTTRRFRYFSFLSLLDFSNWHFYHPQVALLSCKMILSSRPVWPAIIPRQIAWIFPSLPGQYWWRLVFVFSSLDWLRACTWRLYSWRTQSNTLLSLFHLWIKIEAISEAACYRMVKAIALVCCISRNIYFLPHLICNKDLVTLEGRKYETFPEELWS
jgi:hypothetical protein